jgi:hypothetical protein
MVYDDSSIKSLANSIRLRRFALDNLAEELRAPAIVATFDKWNHNSWCIAVAGDSLIRMRLFTEQNFNAIETMGIVAVARYTFELTVWLRLFALDRRYGLVYFDQLLQTQQRFFRDTLAQLEREVAWLKSLEEKEARSQQEVFTHIENGGHDSAAKIEAALSSVSDAIDVEAARRFSIYAQAARTNGYGFQAYLVEEKALPPVRDAIAAIAAERTTFESRVPGDIKALCAERWQWRAMAQKIGRADEYDYLYSFASKLLHATPASITTNQKSLDPSEIELFLRYIDVTISDVIGLASEYRR